MFPQNTFSCARELSVHITDTEPSVHVYCSDTTSQTALQLPRSTAVAAHCCTLPQTVHGTQNTLCMCTAIERNVEQQRRFTYNVRVHCVRVTIVACKTLIIITYSEYVSPLCYSAHKANCGLSGCTIFSTLSHKRLDFCEVLMKRKTCTVVFSTNLFSNIQILRSIQPDIIKNIYRYSSNMLIIIVTLY
jgi:hypothetical protein